MLRFPEAVAISSVIVFETLTSGKVVRIAARLNSAPSPAVQEAGSPVSISSSTKKRKRAKVARVKPIGARKSLQKLDPQEWVILWEGKAKKTDYLEVDADKSKDGKKAPTEKGEEDEENEDEEDEEKTKKFAPALQVSGVISDTIRIDFDGRNLPDYIEVDTVKLKGISSRTASSAAKATGVGAHLLPWVGNDEFADLSIRLDDGSSFPAHKVILAARSDYFKALLTGGMRETGQSEIPIGDLSKEVLQLLMVYLYSGTVECDGDHIIPLFVAADRFTLHDLRAFAVQEFKRCLTIDNVLGLLLAVQEVPLLLDACKLFVLGHYKEVALLPAFETLPQHLLLAFIRQSLK